MLRDKLNLALIAGIVMALCGILVFSSASIVKAAPIYNGIEIRAQDYTTAVTSITFPQAEPGATVSQPYNDVDESGSPQTFGNPGTPVVTLVNTDSGTAYLIYYNITTFENGVVSNEYYLINAKGAECANAGAISNTVTFGADTISVGPTTIAASGEMDLYLKVDLGAGYGKSGTSTLTILGESL